MGVRRKGFHPGRMVGYLKLIRRVRSPRSASPITKNRWQCECLAPKKFGEEGVCGNVVTVPEWYMARPKPKTHCGCQQGTLKSMNRKEYVAWMNMRARCNEPNHISYHHYGGRGIRVCDEWNDPETGFDEFFAYIGKAPTPEHSIDRVNNDLGYQPFQDDGVTPQVKWSTAAEQRANQRPRTYT